MPTVSDYVVVADDTTTLEIGGEVDQTFTFPVPANVNLGQRAVATCMIEVVGPPQGLAWNLRINGTQVIGFTHNQDRFSVIQEVFQGSILQVGSNNAIVTVTAGTGRLEISDIVIHFQVEV